MMRLKMTIAGQTIKKKAKTPYEDDEDDFKLASVSSPDVYARHEVHSFI